MACSWQCYMVGFISGMMAMLVIVAAVEIFVDWLDNKASQRKEKKNGHPPLL